MNGVFLGFLNAGIAASWLILAAVLIRLLLRRAPRWISCALWALVGVRLICPVSPESVLSLIPSAQTVPQDIGVAAMPAIDSGISVIDSAVNPVLQKSLAPAVGASANPVQVVGSVLAAVWLAGAALMLGYAAWSYLRLKKQVRTAVPLQGNVYACDEVQSPFILGIFRPKIYVPSAIKGETLTCVVAHETAHIRRRDHWWKPLGYLLLAVYWFVPPCWLAYVLLCRDIEAACDEKVVRGTDAPYKAQYSQALLDCSLPRRQISACPLAFGEVGVKGRVRAVLNYKKPAFWVIVAAVAACVAVAVCFLTNPLSSRKTELTENQRQMVLGLLEQEKNSRLSADESQYIAVDCDVLGAETKKDGTEVYAWVRYAAYSRDGKTVREESACRVPAVITLGGSPTLWQPRDGAFFEQDVRDRFPKRLQDAVLNGGDPAAQREACRKRAEAYFAAKEEEQIAQNMQVTRRETEDGAIEYTVAAFPGVIFRLRKNKLGAPFLEKDDGQTVQEIREPGLTMLSTNGLFFCDLTGDGTPELCYDGDYGSGTWIWRVTVMDLVKDQTYSWMPRIYSWIALDAVKGHLVVMGKNRNDQHEIKALVIRNGELQTEPIELSPEEQADLLHRRLHVPLKILGAERKAQAGEAGEVFWRAGVAEYFFRDTERVFLLMNDGSRVSIPEALELGYINISDVNQYGVHCGMTILPLLTMRQGGQEIEIVSCFAGHHQPSGEPAGNQAEEPFPPKLPQIAAQLPTLPDVQDLELTLGRGCWLYQINVFGTDFQPICSNLRYVAEWLKFMEDQTEECLVQIRVRGALKDIPGGGRYEYYVYDYAFRVAGKAG